MRLKVCLFFTLCNTHSLLLSMFLLGEAPGQGFLDIIRIIGRSIKDDDNPINKLKSIFLQTTCSKRDKGKPEVARAILGDALVHSTFNYKTVSLDIGNKEIIPLNEVENESQRATYRNLLEFFGDRAAEFQPYSDRIFSFVDFCRHFDVIKGKIKERYNKDKVIIMTTPRIRYNPKDQNTYKDYCYYQMIKYSPWTSSTLKNITKDNSIKMWNEFLENVSEEILCTVR
jgi:hypothetical protein